MPEKESEKKSKTPKWLWPSVIIGGLIIIGLFLFMSCNRKEEIVEEDNTSNTTTNETTNETTGTTVGTEGTSEETTSGTEEQPTEELQETSCQNYCINDGYIDGACRIDYCLGAETRLPPADPFCEDGGIGQDICCCLI